MPFGHRLAAPERLDEYTRNEFERLIAAVSPLLSKMEVDPRDPDSGEILYGQIGIIASLQIQNVWNLPTLSRELGSDVNTFQHENRVLLQLRPSGANRSIHGFKAPAGPDRTLLLIIYNDDDTYTLTLEHASSSATDPRDRMILSGGADAVLSAGDVRAVWLAYSHVQQRWMQINTTTPTHVLNVAAADLAVSNTVTKTDVYSYVVPASTLSAGHAIRFGLFGSLVKNAGAGSTFSIEVSFGGTNIVTGTVLTGLGNSANARMIWLDGLISGVAASTQRAQIRGSFGPASGTAIQTWISFSPSHALHDTLALDSTTALTLRIAVTHSLADAAITFTRHLAWTELL